MDLCWNYFSVYITFLTSVLAQNSISSLSDCRSHQHAYTTLMRYPDGLEVDEGPYCRCLNMDQPESNWGLDNNNVLTWQHYERAHWTVQYRFCGPKFPSNFRECEGRERAAVVQTETTGWHPHLHVNRCRCPKNKLYQLMGWKKENGQWNYFYSCLKDQCKEKNSTCARITVVEEKNDDGEDSFGVIEMQLLCACGEGLLCPAKLQDYDRAHLRQTGASFVEKKCESIKQTGKEKTR
ncbi:hypothetical protein LOTGIDRAFT_239286 [Lottia gigantea]|uniref:Uncharacterized protein n=1 Tax=Lottia gigantea TaxID=225164 RepID=V4AI66_LOTGI|nr:hypothetical protein LOTGIDRAFT_239286 [Lottia gigantea]ESO96622.1 hypothetical protein LOTGIDRAFT_239286 [Lottia gigantea]